MPGTNNKDKEKKNKTPNGALQALAVTTTIGVELAVSVVAGYYGGKYLDGVFATGPWLLLTGVLVGLAVGVVGVYKTLMGFFERE
ncbi:MAG: AtpZ/AtpI family protein [Peptococcaceae bacterium]|nr:AtpZ/AtpI family protein [Peptococcaceae bacterium]NQS75473.1 AtpZ/AtpI family protein [Candidatus Syntrophopropionicum ammoniitolerans]